MDLRSEDYRHGLLIQSTKGGFIARSSSSKPASLPPFILPGSIESAGYNIKNSRHNLWTRSMEHLSSSSSYLATNPRCHRSSKESFTRINNKNWAIAYFFLWIPIKRKTDQDDLLILVNEPNILNLLSIDLIKQASKLLYSILGVTFPE